MTGCSTATNSRTAFNQLIQRPRVPLTPTVEEVPNTNGLVQLKFSFATEAGQRVPGILFKRPGTSDRRPTVIALHGTGGSKGNMLALCRKLATNGFVAVAIDGRYHGERTKGKGTEEYFAAITKTWASGKEHPFYYDTVWDVQRLIDYLQTRPDVDARRIGLIGFSKGGTEACLAAASDPRIGVVVPCIGVQSFDWGLKNNAWQGRIKTIQPAFDAVTPAGGATNATMAAVKDFYDRVVPGIYGKFDGPAMLALIAPRPLLVINSDNDPNTPLPGVMESADAARQAYRAKNAGDRFVLRIQANTGHQVKPESERAAIEWFVKWLEP
jgi:dienelactone hydrolase